MYHIYLDCPNIPKECVASKLHPAVAERAFQRLLRRRDLIGSLAEVTLTLDDKVLSRYQFSAPSHKAS